MSDSFAILDGLGALGRVRERILVDHPSTRGYRFIPEKTLEELRLRLSQAVQQGAEALEAFGTGLTSRELIGIIRGVAGFCLEIVLGIRVESCHRYRTPSSYILPNLTRANRSSSLHPIVATHCRCGINRVV